MPIQADLMINNLFLLPPAGNGADIQTNTALLHPFPSPLSPPSLPLLPLLPRSPKSFFASNPLSNRLKKVWSFFTDAKNHVTKIINEELSLELPSKKVPNNKVANYKVPNHKLPNLESS
jgi:hypothetical protein